MTFIENEKRISLKKKCELLSVNRSGLYYKRKPGSSEDIILMNRVYEIYTKYSFFGYRKVHAMLQRESFLVNRKKVQRLMRKGGLKAVQPKKSNFLKSRSGTIHPYLLKEIMISEPNQAWQVDITYIKIKTGFVYLVCLIDIYSRRIMGWNASVFLDTDSCVKALEQALLEATPIIVNSDQGSQFTSNSWCDTLNKNQILISMDGKGRWADNIYIERLWRTIKYELIYLHRFESVLEVKSHIAQFIKFYNEVRPHQALKYQVPIQAYKEFYGIKKIDNTSKGATIENYGYYS